MSSKVFSGYFHGAIPQFPKEVVIYSWKHLGNRHPINGNTRANKM